MFRQRISTWALCGALTLVGSCASTPPATEGADAAAPAAVSEREVVIQIEGNEVLSRGDLVDPIGDELIDFRRSGFRKWPIDDAAYRMEQRYAREGYPFAQVDYEIAGVEEQGPVQVLFRVTPGVRTRLMEVLFEGARAYGEDTLRAYFGTQGGDTPWYQRSEIGAGLSALEERYLTEGYADVRFSSPETLFSEDRTEVRVTVRVEEGPRYTVGAVELGELDEELAPALRILADEVRGEPFELRLPFRLRSQIEQELAEQGYLEAEVDVTEERDPGTGEVRLEFAIRAGEQVRIDEIVVRGNESTRESTVLRRLAFGPGDLYTKSAERESFERLYRLGIFRGVSVRAERREQGGWRCVVELDEAQTADWYVEPGYGSYERLRLTLGFRERNGLGRAVPIRAEITGGAFAVRGVLSVAQPGFLGLHPDLTGEMKLFGGRREEPSFTEEELGVNTGVSYRWSRNLSGALEYQFKQTDVVEVLANDADSQAALGDIDVSSVAASLSLDTRDHVFLPTTGGNSRISLEFADEALGSKLDFTRLRFSQSLFHPLRDGTVLAFGWQLGAIVPHGSTAEIPLQERFFNGGENSVRSFFEDELGPAGTNGKPVGGEAYSAFSLELRQELEGNLGGALFFDYGTLAEQAEDVLDLSAAETGWAVGLGLRYFLPIGPVRLDAGWNPDATADQDDVVVHLSVGMAF